jgi:hypothetical protein
VKLVLVPYHGPGGLRGLGDGRGTKGCEVSGVFRQCAPQGDGP